jgi:hypothetical protein
MHTCSYTPTLVTHGNVCFRIFANIANKNIRKLYLKKLRKSTNVDFSINFLQKGKTLSATYSIKRDNFYEITLINEIFADVCFRKHFVYKTKSK